MITPSSRYGAIEKLPHDAYESRIQNGNEHNENRDGNDGKQVTGGSTDWLGRITDGRHATQHKTDEKAPRITHKDGGGVKIVD
jgi:hypothetical protein